MIYLFIIMIIANAVMFTIYSINDLLFYYFILYNTCIILFCIIRKHDKACHWMLRFDLIGQFEYYFPGATN